MANEVTEDELRAALTARGLDYDAIHEGDRRTFRMFAAQYGDDAYFEKTLAGGDVSDDERARLLRWRVLHAPERAGYVERTAWALDASDAELAQLSAVYPDLGTHVIEYRDRVRDLQAAEEQRDNVTRFLLRTTCLLVGVLAITVAADLTLGSSLFEGWTGIALGVLQVAVALVVANGFGLADEDKDDARASTLGEAS